jgi:hypothetical protein
MPSPFPGMDPYVEDPAVFPDCHDALIIFMRGLLQPQLRPRYAALTRDRQIVVSPDRPRLPDVAVVKSARRSSSKGHATAVLEADTPRVFEESDEREPYLEIVNVETKRLVAAIEVLSPDNKRSGPGRRSYLRKRRELRKCGVSVVEIDLLREGKSTVRLTEHQKQNLHPWHYLVVVSRRSPAQVEAYPIALSERLPRVAIPLERKVRDVTLDLQAAFTRAWDESGYPAVIDYDGPPVGKLSSEELAWCDKLVRKARLRTR